jgi:hypothetical protein
MAWTTAPTFTAGTSPPAATLNIIRDDLNLIGGAWSTYTPTWTGATTNPVLGNGTIAGRYKLIGDKTCHVQIKLTMGTTTTYGSGNWLFSLPSGTNQETAALFPIGVAMAQDASAGPARYTGTVEVSSSTAVLVMNNATGAGMTATVPFTWASTDVLYFSFMYELA